MSDWVLFNTPAAIILYALALCLLIFTRTNRKAHEVSSVFAAILTVIGTAVLLLAGGSLYEAATVIIVFFLVNTEVAHEL